MASTKPNASDFSSRTQALLAQTGTLANSAMAAAAKELKEQQDKQDQEKALKALKNADNFLQQKVAALKVARELERRAKKSLKTFDQAFAEFVKDGDLKKFSKATEIPESVFLS